MPDGEKPVIPPPPAIHIERTLALIKPDAIHKSDEIEEIILQHGFTILEVRKLKLNYVYNLHRNKKISQIIYDHFLTFPLMYVS